MIRFVVLKLLNYCTICSFYKRSPSVILNPMWTLMIYRSLSCFYLDFTQSFLWHKDYNDFSGKSHLGLLLLPSALGCLELLGRRSLSLLSTLQYQGHQVTPVNLRLDATRQNVHNSRFRTKIRCFIQDHTHEQCMSVLNVSPAPGVCDAVLAWDSRESFSSCQAVKPI